MRMISPKVVGTKVQCHAHTNRTGHVKLGGHFVSKQNNAMVGHFCCFRATNHFDKLVLFLVLLAIYW